MIKFENTEVMGWEAAIRGMRNPMNSWEKSDSRNNIITLCGSSKFKNEFLKIQKELSLKGYLVLSLGLFGHSGDDEAWGKKDLLDKVHKQKIDMSSAIFVIDVDGYVGESTKHEIEYTLSRGKTVYFYSHNDLEVIREITKGSFIGPNDLNLMKRLAAGGPVHAKYRRMITVYVDITAPLYWWKEFDTYKVGTVANSCSTMHKIADHEFTRDDFSLEHLKPRSLDVLDKTIMELNIWRDIYINGYPAEMGYDEIKPKDKEVWWQMIQLLPSSYNQKRTVMLNYEVLAGIYPMRKNHKLDEWAEHNPMVIGIDTDEGSWSLMGFCDWIKTLPYSKLITMEVSTND